MATAVKTTTLKECVVELITFYSQQATGPGPLWASTAKHIISVLQNNTPAEALIILRKFKKGCEPMTVASFYEGAAKGLAEAIRKEKRAAGKPAAMEQGTVKQTKLTDLQKTVLAKLHATNHPFLAEATEQHWKRGEAYYIDDRVNVSKRLRAAFNKANPESK